MSEEDLELNSYTIFGSTKNPSYAGCKVRTFITSDNKFYRLIYTKDGVIKEIIEPDEYGGMSLVARRNKMNYEDDATMYAGDKVPNFIKNIDQRECVRDAIARAYEEGFRSARNLAIEICKEIYLSAILTKVPQPGAISVQVKIEDQMGNPNYEKG